MKRHTPPNGGIITAENKIPSLNSMTRISPIPLTLACALFFGAAQTISTAVQAAVVKRPDLSVTVLQPKPALLATAMSQVQVRVSNAVKVANAPINVTFTLPANVTAPLKFSRDADHWVCTTSGQIVSCAYDLPLYAGRVTNLRIPVTPLASSLGATPSPFVASVAAAPTETNLANNGPVSMVPAVPVAALALTGIADPTGTYSLPVLSPMTIPKYALPLPNPTAPSYKHTPNTVSAPGADSYTLDIKQVKAQILPPGFPATDVFAYGDPARPDTFTYPAHTIVARSTDVAVNASGLGKPVKVQYLNTLTATGHIVPVDHSIHGTNAGEPDIRSVGHLHGAKIINENSDGYPEAWHSPNGQNGLPMTVPSVPYNPNAFDYTNNQESTMLWYHDHTLGMTRLNVYAGLAGLYMIRDDNETAMIANNQLPSGPHEVPLVLQDRMFHADGSLAYPDVDVIGTGVTPSTVPEFFGDVMVVNGAAWPYLQVEPRKYRFRILNGSNARFYTIGLKAGAAGAPIPFQLIGSDGGFLNAPTTATTLTVAPAERYDIIVDFSALKGKNITLTNSAGTPFGGAGAVAPTIGLHDQLMQFKVNLPLSVAPAVTIPAALRVPIAPLVQTDPLAAPHQVLLGETVDEFNRILPILGTPALGLLGWMDSVTEHPLNNTVETWEIFNNSVDAHPVHLHDGDFQVIERQPFNAVLGTKGELTNITYPAPATPALVAEKGWKDSVIAYPSLTSNPLAVPGDVVNGQVTRVRMKFEGFGQFVWHCHITEHEDHDMMRPMSVLQ
jgi:spore coat protein A, manganese oxidase